MSSIIAELNCLCFSFCVVATGILATCSPKRRLRLRRREGWERARDTLEDHIGLLVGGTLSLSFIIEAGAYLLSKTTIE